MGRYNRYMPDRNSPGRFWETIKRFSKFYYSGAFKYERSKVHRLRVNPKRQGEIKRLRRELDIPEQGYRIREARRRLRSSYKAYLQWKYNIGTPNEKKVNRWLAIHGAIQTLSKKYRFNRHYPTPYMVAFEDLLYRRPQQSEPSLTGYYLSYPDNRQEPIVLLGDKITEAPRSIGRMVKYCLRGDDNEMTRNIRIYRRSPWWGEWEVSKLA